MPPLETALRQQFKQSIRCGTGKAYLLLRKHHEVDFSKYILQAAVKNYAYDPQSEGDRAKYVAGLISQCNNESQIVDEVLTALLNEKEDCWALDQLFAIAAIWAKQGVPRARSAMYERFAKKAIPSCESFGAEAILELDGLEGLKQVAIVRGKAMMKNPDDCEDGWLIKSFQEEQPEIDVYKELSILAKKDRFIRKYLEEVTQLEESRSGTSSRSRFSYELVNKNIRSKNRFPVPPVGIKELMPEEINRLAKDFIQESKPELTEKYLWIFSRTKFPFDPLPILNIAKGENTGENRLIEFACKALSYFKSDDIRKLALTKLRKPNPDPNYLYLLVGNYEKGDYDLLNHLIGQFSKEEDIHHLVWGLTAIYEGNNTEECKEPLEAIYQVLTCSLHRNQIVEILHKNEVMADWILKEIEFDSLENTREFYRRIIENA